MNHHPERPQPGFLTIDRLRKKFEQRVREWRGLESAHSVMNSRRYLETVLADERLHSKELLRPLLKADFVSFFDEVVSWKTPALPYKPNGLGGYLVEMDALGQGFIRELQDKGALPFRAELESFNLKKLLVFIKDTTIPLGTRLTWTSPRGRAPAYPGLDPKNPVKFNVYTKTNPSPENPYGVLFQQYNAWPKNEGLSQLHIQVQEQGGELFMPSEQDFSKNLELKLINEMFLIPPATNIDLEHMLYQDEATWPVQRSEYPIFDREWFDRLVDEVFEFFFLKSSSIILDKAIPHAKNDPKKWTTSPEYKQSLKLLDALFETCAKGIFTQITAKNETESANNALETDPDLNQLKDSVLPWAERPRLILTEMKLRWELRSELIQAKKLSSEQVKKLRALDVAFSVSNRIFSLSQCGLLAPFSAAAQGFSVSALELGALPLTTRNELLSSLKSYVRLELKGATQVWYVPADYLEAPGCTVRSDGVVLGPCKTPEHPDGIPLNDPLETLAMTEDRYLMTVSNLEKSLLKEQIANLDQTPEGEAFLQENSPWLEPLLAQATLRVTLTSLINGIPEVRDTSIEVLPPDLLKQLLISTNPLATLKQIATMMSEKRTSQALAA